MYMKHAAILIGLLLIVSMVFAGGTASAIGDIVPSTDNIKQYDAVTNTVTVSAKADQTVLATVRLLTPKINYVGIGYQKIAEFELDAKTSSTDFLKAMYFFDRKQADKGITRTYDVRVEVEYTEEVPTYNKECTGENDKEVCQWMENGKEVVTKIRYDLLTEKSFAEGKKKISIWTTTYEGERIEWIPELYGVVVNEWATWDASINNDLNTWYKFDEASGTVSIDAKGYDHNGKIMTLDINVPGKIDKGYGFLGGSTNYMDTYNKFGNTRTRFSISAWIYPENPAENDGIVISRNAGVSGISMHDANSIYGWVNSTSCTGPANAITVNRWNHVVMTYDGNSIKVYTDSNLICQIGKTGAMTIDANWLVGRDSVSGSFNFDGNIDEVAFWDTNLSANDINNLYNAGAGITYPFPGGTPVVKTTFNVYRVGQATHLTGITLDANVNALDLSGQNSPFDTIPYDINTVVSATFSRAGYDNNTFVWRGDANNTYTIYLKDTTAPTVGVTTKSGFTTYGSFIKGTGIIVGGAVSDAGSGIDNTSCEVQYFAAGAWFAGNWNTDHCESDPFTAAEGSVYTMNTRIKDNSGNTGTGTASTAFTGNSSAPNVGQTSFTGFTEYTTGGYWFKGTGTIIGGLATDTNSGIDNTTCEYTSNNGAAWAGATWSVNHCVQAGFVPNNGISYTFNTRIQNNLATLGTGTATYTYIGDTVGPTVTSNAVVLYYNEPIITLTPNDGTGSGAKRTWYCTDAVNTCTPNILGTSITLPCANGFLCTFYIRAISMDNLDNNGDVYSTGLITIDRQTAPPAAITESNKGTWLDLTNMFAENLFGFDYTTLGICALFLIAIMAFVFKLSTLVAIIMAIPVTYAFLMLAGGASFILWAILVLEGLALILKIAISIFNIGNQGA